MSKDTSQHNRKAIQFLRWPEVHKRIGISKSYAYALQAKGLFPKPLTFNVIVVQWCHKIDESSGFSTTQQNKLRT